MIAILVVTSAAAVGACKKTGHTGTDAGPSASGPLSHSARPTPGIAPARASAGPMASNIPLPAASVDNQVNPTHRAAYSGPTGSVEGVVKLKGDQAPSQEYKYTSGCEGARPTYDKLFREGPGRVAPDVLVAVTEYDGFIPAKEPAATVVVKDCAYDRRTVFVTFGQRVEVSNLDEKQSYLPFLAGVSAPAHMVLPPKGQGGPVKLYPLDIGRFLLVDEMSRPWMKADVYVLKYPTATITGLDGKFRIDGIPVGKVKVSALLPLADLTGKTEVSVEDGKTVTADFVLEYKKPAPAASASAPARKGPVLK
jgi:hypothetical protein